MRKQKSLALFLGQLAAGQRLNNCAAILRFEKRDGDESHPRLKRALEPVVRLSKPPAGA